MRWVLPLLACLGVGACFRGGFENFSTPPRPAFQHTWTVTVVDDRLAGPADLASIGQLEPGTQGLSLREALLLAQRSPGNDRIAFDPGVFRAQAPTASILVDTLPPLTDGDILIDGSGAGVVLHGDAVAGPCLELRASGLVLRHLALVNCGDPALRIEAASDVQLEDVSIEGTRGRGLAASASARLQLTDLSIRSSAEQGLWLEQVQAATATRFHSDDSGRQGVQATACRGVVLQDGQIVRSGDDALLIQDSQGMRLQRLQVVLDDKTATHGIHLLRTASSEVLDCFVDPGSAWMIALGDASDNLIRGNLIEGGDSGIVLYGDSDRNRILQNIVTGCVYDGVYLHGGCDDNLVAHTSVAGCSSGVVGELDTSQVANNLLSSDDFVDPAAFDFQLIAGSAAIDAGEDLGLDLLPDAAARFLGQAPDLGAVESY